jgi:hypothetical protein
MIEMLFAAQLAERFGDIDTELGILGVAYFLCYYLLGQYVFQKVRLRLII